ncbi:MAG: ATP-grasp domain-containing protein [Candidatus Jordarchaeaceae archaeon]
MKLLVFEFFSGGGFVEGELSGLIDEAYAMLRCAVEDFQKAGFYVFTTLDHRIAEFNPSLKANHVRVVYNSDSEVFRELLNEVDAAFLIAPETGGVLCSLAVETVKSGVELFSPLPSAIELTADKSKLLEIAEKLGLNVPEHRVLETTSSFDEVGKIASNMGYPVVFKVLDGAGSEGMSLVRRSEEIPLAMEKIRSVSNRGLFLLEKFVEGIDASVSLVSNGETAFPLSLNSQSMRMKSPLEESKYEGGYVPLRHRLKDSAFEAAKTLVENIEGLQGYVGVDLIISEDKVTILEVNPRLTTSYLGLRRVLRQNVAKIISEAVTRKVLPPKTNFDGCAYFKKLEIPENIEIDEEKFRKIARYQNLAAPPFPVKGKKNAILVVHSKNEELAKLEMEKMKRKIIKELTGKESEVEQ